MSSCENFTENAWRPELCSTCQRSRVEHEGHQNKVGSGSRSWRRRSEPDPNNSITGNKISTLASKFQGREARSGSLTDAIGVGGHNNSSDSFRKSTSAKKKTSNENTSTSSSSSFTTFSRLNNSRSADLLDSITSNGVASSSSSSSSTKTTLSSTRLENRNTSTKSFPLPSSSSSTSSSTAAKSGTDSSSSSPSTRSAKERTSPQSSFITVTNDNSISSSSTNSSNFTSQKAPPTSNRRSLISSSSSSSSSTTSPSSSAAVAAATSSSTTITSTSTNPKPRVNSKTPLQQQSTNKSCYTASIATSSAKQKTTVTVSNAICSTRTSVLNSSVKTTNSYNDNNISSHLTKSKRNVVINSSKSASPSSLSSSPTSILKSSSSTQKKEQTSDQLPEQSSGSRQSKRNPGFSSTSRSDSVSGSGSEVSKRVVFLDEYSVIGTDGGLDNSFAGLSEQQDGIVGSCEGDDGDDNDDDKDDNIISLCDGSRQSEEEKQFTLLAVGNTVWNSDTRNLQVDADVSKRTCREFEDLPPDFLWGGGKRFTSLTDCDGISALKSHRPTPFNSYPQISSGRAKSSTVSKKLSAQSIGKSCGANLKTKGKEGDSPASSKKMEAKSCDNSINSNNSSSAAFVDRLKGERWSAVTSTSGSSSVTSLNSDVDGGSSGGGRSHLSHQYFGGSTSGGSSADSGVEMGSRSNSLSGKDRRPSSSYTVGDITDCLYETVDEILPEKQRLERGIGGDDNSKVGPSSIIGKEDNSEMSQSGLSFPDEFERLDMSLTTFEGFQAISLLNDVLRDYSDLNESSTDEAANAANTTTSVARNNSFGDSDTVKESSVDGRGGSKDLPGAKSKKSSAFEARMASIAAGLDLSKQQQQKGKRQAPRPPVSPPPEPNLSQGVSPKKSNNSDLPDPVFKMVPVGKSIMPLPPPTSDIPKQSSTKSGNVAPLGLEDFTVASSSSENPDSPNDVKSNGDAQGGKKKGFTSFFKNILRRGGKESSSDSFESANPDVQLNSKFDDVNTGNGNGSKNRSGANSSAAAEGGKSGDVDSQSGLVPSNSTSLSSSSSSSVSSTATGDDAIGTNHFLHHHYQATTTTSSSSLLSSSSIAASSSSTCSTAVSLPSSSSAISTVTTNAKSSSTTLSSTSSTSSSSTLITTPSSILSSSSSTTHASSPPTQKKSRGMPSPKMMLKKATAKFSPPASRRLSPKSSTESRESSLDQDAHASNKPPSSIITSSTPSAASSSAVASAIMSKPYPAPKPTLSKPPPSQQTSATSTATTTTTSATTITAGRDSSGAAASHPGPAVVRRRAKSPKRSAPPVPPSRPGMMAGAMPSGGTPTGTLTRSELRESTRRSMPVPPPAPPPPPIPTSTTTDPSTTTSSPPSPIPEADHSPSSPSSPFMTTSAFDFQLSQISGGSTSTVDSETMVEPKFVEKIELPMVANQGRKGILGKLSSVNRKNKAPHPPSSVKRAKSITESSTLPRGDKSKNKRINVADISGPVIVQDLSVGHVLENRRNTISLGDDPALQAIASMSTGSTSSSTAMGTDKDKEGFDEFDMPILSPLGSLENLYESILPQPDSASFHYYEPSSLRPKPICPNIPADGYLEPVPPASMMKAASSIATSTNSTTDINITTTTSSLLSTSSSVSNSVSASMTNISVVKSPSRADPIHRQSNTSKSLDNVFDSLEPSKPSSSITSSSSSSSETNSAENSGSSLPDSFFQSLPRTSKNSQIQNSTGVGIGMTFVEPEMTEQRRNILASQPIYEEIPNGFNDEQEKEESNDFKDFTRECKSGAKESTIKLPSKSLDRGSGKSKNQPSKKSSEGVGVMSASFHSAMATTMPNKNSKDINSAIISSSVSLMSKSQHVQPPPTPPLPPPAAPSSSNPSSSSSSSKSSTLGQPSPHHHHHHSSPSRGHNINRQTSSSSLMTTSLTSSMLPPPPPPPPDHLPAPPLGAVRSLSRETMATSSAMTADSDSHTSFCTLPRPRAAPRRKAKRPETAGSDQYVSMNKPNLQISLHEDKLRDLLNRMSLQLFQSLQEIYVQYEKILSVDKLGILPNQQVTWRDLDIYGQPVHATGKCVVYNAKLKTNGQSCQVMSLHPGPHTDLHPSVRPSLLRQSAVFVHAIPFSFLTPDFIKTSQLLQNCASDAIEARCLVSVGKFDIVESLETHLSLLREAMTSDPQSYLNVVLTIALQLLSAMSHCLDQGFAVTETDYHDVFLLSRSDLRGKVVAFLPQQRSSDVLQGEAMCNFVDRLLVSAFPAFCDDNDEGDDDDDDSDNEEDDDDEDETKVVSAPKKIVTKLRSMLEGKRVENLGQVRTGIEYLLWGPRKADLPVTPTGAAAKSSMGGGGANGAEGNGGGGTSKEQELYMWLEVQRSHMVGQLASREGGLNAGLNVEEYYRLKFLLKTSAMSLTESLRRLLR